MRKRKRGYGSYTDEDTGEVTIVQTTKQAKRNHQKHGKWYKEPTERELRAWDWEEKRQAAADKAARREQSKKINAAKRSGQVAKEQELKRQLFHAGKITFTQTLAEKAEDQRNLHSWFGGKPAYVKSRAFVDNVKLEVPANGCVNGQVTVADNAISRQDGSASDDNKGIRLATESPPDTNSCHETNQYVENPAESPAIMEASDRNSNLGVDRQPEPADRDQHFDLEMDLLMSSQVFDIAEDSDAETEGLEHVQDELQQESYNIFSLPALPNKRGRAPLSPMSQSDLNARATGALNTSSFGDKLFKAGHSVPPSSTQIVRDFLTGISTQDLEIDLDDDVSDDKENQKSESDGKVQKEGSTEPAQVPSQKQIQNAAYAKGNEPFTALGDSSDYSDTFAEIDAIEKNEADEDFDDDGLDDATLLSVSATQLVRSAGNPKPQAALYPAPAKNSKPRRAFTKFDSFAVEGLADEDLLAGLEEFERSWNQLMTPAANSKKKRALPWERQDWIAQTTGGDEEVT